jgi:hypothetical protein
MALDGMSHQARLQRILPAQHRDHVDQLVAANWPGSETAMSSDQSRSRWWHRASLTAEEHAASAIEGSIDLPVDLD